MVRPIVGWFFTVCLTFCSYAWMCELYEMREAREVGYSAEYRLRLDEIVANITPLSVADLGELE